MNPTSTLRMRRWTAFVAMAWALLAIFLSVASLRIAPGRPQPSLQRFAARRPGRDRGAGALRGRAAEPAPATASSRSTASPISTSCARAATGCAPACPTSTCSRSPTDGSIRFSLPPVPASVTRTPIDTLFHALLLVVALIYLVTGGAVWWMRPDRSGAWALLLFCSTMSVQLATVIQTDDIPWSFPRLMLNLPLIGATTFHLFTSYPIEPDWIVRHRRIQLLPYLGRARARRASRSPTTRSGCAPGLGSLARALLHARALRGLVRDRRPSSATGTARARCAITPTWSSSARW